MRTKLELALLDAGFKEDDIAKLDTATLVGALHNQVRNLRAQRHAACHYLSEFLYSQGRIDTNELRKPTLSLLELVKLTLDLAQQ